MVIRSKKLVTSESEFCSYAYVLLEKLPVTYGPWVLEVINVTGTFGEKSEI